MDIDLEKKRLIYDFIESLAVNKSADLHLDIYHHIEKYGFKE